MIIFITNKKRCINFYCPSYIFNATFIRHDYLVTTNSYFSFFLQGGLAVGVPGEIKGYYSAKQRYGNPNITWASLLEPSIKMAEEGITVSWSLASSLASVSELVYSDPGLR